MASKDYEEPVFEVEPGSTGWESNTAIQNQTMPFFHFKRYDIILRYIDMYGTAVRSGRTQFMLDWYSNLYQLFINLTQKMRMAKCENKIPLLNSFFDSGIAKYNETLTQPNTSEGNFRKNLLVAECIRIFNYLNNELNDVIDLIGLGVEYTTEFTNNI